MKPELKLSDIACYLPYGLKLYDPSVHDSTVRGWLSNEYMQWDEGYDSQGKDVLIGIPWWENMNRAKPLLRPMSMLYQTIVHEGKEEVPIVELAKISRPDIKDWEPSFFGGSDPHPLSATGTLDDKTYFFEWRNDFGFCFMGLMGMNALPTCNQTELWQYLHSRFFDYRGLIERGLAIKMEE